MPVAQMLRIPLEAAGGALSVWIPAGGSIELTCFDTAEVKLVLISKDLYWLLQNRS